MDAPHPPGSPTPEADAAVEALWTAPAARTRGPKPAFTRQDIARTAVRIADADGLDAVSMARMGQELNVTKMALYRYVANKAELFAIMIEEAAGEPPNLAHLPTWRARVEAFTAELAVHWNRHPWLPLATIGNRLMGPREVGWIESLLSTLDDTGLTTAERLDTVFLVFGHMRNTQSMTTAGTQPWTDDKGISSPLRTLMEDRREHFPALLAALDDVTAAEATGPPADNGRAFGLSLILDGVEALITSRADAG
ncbi:TetR/AcrR family transcriptional regulator [Yinghuangia seranimata]|uniref:TetR/AcrR family transcriptional regulator n=1 Tax=Yinghuangia seranimata TaxID=408067 RepID=UPI00248B3F90|nr:TetR/AcrR family transcriptional regulator [Yinghuangia seranimata]MDI2125221.1 TetR/AcrR family transcriptional regulator [Yinghuangia seranimata]